MAGGGGGGCAHRATVTAVSTPSCRSLVAIPDRLPSTGVQPDFCKRQIKTIRSLPVLRQLVEAVVREVLPNDQRVLRVLQDLQLAEVGVRLAAQAVQTARAARAACRGRHPGRLCRRERA